MNGDIDCLTVQECAAALRVTPMSVYRWIDEGIIPAAKIGGRVRIRKSALARLLDAKESGGVQHGDATGYPSLPRRPIQPPGITVLRETPTARRRRLEREAEERAARARGRACGRAT